MSRNILRYTTNLELQSIATNIISAQTKSISNMQAIQCKCNICPELKPILYAIITTQCEGIKQLKKLLNQLDHC